MKFSTRFLLLFLILIALSSAYAQMAIPKGYFSPPLHIALSMTGSFAEVRANHLHSGIDFSVQQKEGLPVYAVADGLVSRIKVSPYGFGNALYIDHPNGFTSVYGHLKAYSDNITKYLRDNQYQEKSFEVDLFPKNKKVFIYVKKGQLIGYAGNSGSSEGAHLHFEMRDTKTERIINPLLFNYGLVDRIAPYIDFIKIYPEDVNTYVSGSNKAVRFNLRKGENNTYHLAGHDTIDIWGNVSVGVQAFDYNQSKNDRNGFYKLKMLLDKQEFFAMQADSFAFDETRYVNASLDYADSYNTGSRIVKSKKLPGNQLSFFNTDNGRGILTFTDKRIHEINIEVADEAGNNCRLRFWAKSAKPEGFAAKPWPTYSDSSVLIRYDKAGKAKTNQFTVDFPIGSVYEEIHFMYKIKPGGKGVYSDICYLHNPEVPIHSKIKVAIKANKLPQRLQSKALLARIDRQGKRTSAGGVYENGYVSTMTNQFDGYVVVVDTIPPVIKPYPDNLRNKTMLRFTVSDNFSGIKKYKGEVNGQWALVSWDPKNKLMTYLFDKEAKQGKNVFKLTLEDEKGNHATYSTSFTK